jgi:hypothetical protein
MPFALFAICRPPFYQIIIIITESGFFCQEKRGEKWYFQKNVLNIRFSFDFSLYFGSFDLTSG